MAKATLVFTSAKTCPACINFANVWPEIKKKLASPNLEIVEISLANTGSQIDAKYPKNLSRYVKWYPTFSLFRSDTWKEALSNSGIDYPLGGYVFNGDFDQKGVLNMRNKFIPDGDPIYPLTAEGLSSWIKQTGLVSESTPTVNKVSNSQPLQFNKTVFVPFVGNNKPSVCGTGGPIRPPKTYHMY
jgi:hypothetical protein